MSLPALPKLSQTTTKLPVESLATEGKFWLFVGSEFQVNTYTTNNQKLPSVASDSSGNFFVVWQSAESALPPGGPWFLRGQRYLPEPGTGFLQMAGTLAVLGLAGWRRARA